MTLIKFEINQPFPVSIPENEGAFMELWGDGLVVLIQMPNLKKQEIKAFKKSFKRYSYFESSTPVPIALWVFDFPIPHGPIDCNFNARIVKPTYINNYLALEEDRVKNAVTFYLLDREILKGIKLVGLSPDAIKLFHSTIRKQLVINYSQSDYDRYLAGIYQYSTQQLFQMGSKFIMKRSD